MLVMLSRVPAKASRGTMMIVDAARGCASSEPRAAVNAPTQIE
jgi:hypothetical protein